jgi:hypothetical protein
MNIENQPTNTNQIENIPIPETRERIIELLKKYPDNIKPYVDYIERREKEVQVQGDSLEETERKTLEFLIEQAEMLRDAGITEFAISAYEDVLLMVDANIEKEGMKKVYNEILLELEKLEQ